MLYNPGAIVGVYPPSACVGNAGNPTSEELGGRILRR